MGSEVVNGLFQIAVTIIGAVTATVIKKFERKPERAPNVDGARVGGDAPPQRHLLDLSVLLIYGAFLSAILSHSIFISGQQPDFSEVLGGVAAITAVTALVLYFAWRKGYGEMAAGAMSLAALIVLLIAPGNITQFKHEPGREAGLPLPLPVFALTFATSVAAMYLYGNPLGRENSPRRRRNVAIVLGVLAIGTSLILGFDFVADSVHDDLAPKFSGTDDEVKAAATFMATVRSMSLERRGVFYQMASDALLSSRYRAAYYDTEPAVKQWDDLIALVRNQRENPAAAVKPVASTPVVSEET
ncbi:MAG TPA: hypothetical protein VEU30_07830, partial [Thermoanaerobaculia bacterium]|nr:hypothetical protein [Thermoanaerobaculia bacterium]